MKVAYFVGTESGSFLIYEGEHSEEEIAEMNHAICDFIEVITNATKS